MRGSRMFDVFARSARLPRHAGRAIANGLAELNGRTIRREKQRGHSGFNKKNVPFFQLDLLHGCVGQFETQGDGGQRGDQAVRMFSEILKDWFAICLLSWCDPQSTPSNAQSWLRNRLSIGPLLFGVRLPSLVGGWIDWVVCRRYLAARSWQTLRGRAIRRRWPGFRDGGFVVQRRVPPPGER